MRKTLILLAAGLAMLMAQPEVADAQVTYHIWMQGYLVRWGNAHIRAFNGSGMEDFHVGVGSLRATIDGVPFDHPLYCVDVLHSFNFGDEWDVTRELIPPDPPVPPPHNTREAAWIYDTFGLTQSGAAEVGGIQLALWEVTHDPNWRSNWGAGNWWATGDFQYTDGATSGRAHASSILTGLLALNPDDLTARAFYYEPWPRVDNDYVGQGFIGDDVVPEPGVLMLLGTGLLGVAGAAWRKRARV